MNQLELIAKLKVDNISSVDNLMMIEYIYEESFLQLNNASCKFIRTKGVHPLSLICKSIENTFSLKGKVDIDAKLDTALIELYSFSDIDEITINRATGRLYLLIDNLLHGIIC